MTLERFIHTVFIFIPLCFNWHNPERQQRRQRKPGILNFFFIFSFPQSYDSYRLFATGSSWHVVLWVLPPGWPAAPRRKTQARWWSKASTTLITTLIPFSEIFVPQNTTSTFYFVEVQEHFLTFLMTRWSLVHLDLLCFVMKLCVQFLLAVLRSKEKIETPCYKFKTKYGSYISLQSQWFSFTNPWTKEVEFIVSLNRVLS